jgi:site-specific DNA recombinase
MRAGLYARVSREEQVQGYSLGTQLKSMQRYAETRGWATVEYVEEGFTARTDERPQWERLMADARLGELDVVMVHRLDRGFRNLEDQLRDLRLFKEWAAAFVSVQEGFDDSTSHGRFSQNVKGAVNQYYSDLLSEKVTDGKSRARSHKWGRR